MSRLTLVLLVTLTTLTHAFFDKDYRGPPRNSRPHHPFKPPGFHGPKRGKYSRQPGLKPSRGRRPSRGYKRPPPFSIGHGHDHIDDHHHGGHGNTPYGHGSHHDRDEGHFDHHDSDSLHDHHDPDSHHHGGYDSHSHGKTPYSHGSHHDSDKGHFDHHDPDSHHHIGYDSHGHGNTPYGHGSHYGSLKGHHHHDHGHHGQTTSGSESHRGSQESHGKRLKHHTKKLPTSTPADLSLFRLQCPLTGEAVDRGEAEETICQGFIPDCTKNSHVRSIDGTCTNLDKPTQGAAGTPFRRLGGPYYDRVGDSNSAQRNKDLPDPMALSRDLFTDLDLSVHSDSEVDTKHTMFALAFMQYVFSDVSKRAVAASETTCCEQETNPECAGTPEFVASSEATETCSSITFTSELGALGELCYSNFGFGEDTMRDCDTDLVCVQDEVSDTGFKGICRTECSSDEQDVCSALGATGANTMGKMCYKDTEDNPVCYCMPNEVDVGDDGCAQTCNQDSDCDADVVCIDPDRDGQATCYASGTCSDCGDSGICYTSDSGATGQCFYPHKYLDNLGLASCTMADTTCGSSEICMPLREMISELTLEYTNIIVDPVNLMGVTDTQGLCVPEGSTTTGVLISTPDCASGALFGELDGLDVCACDFGDSTTTSAYYSSATNNICSSLVT